MRPKDIFGKNLKSESISKDRWNKVKDKHCVVIYYKQFKKGRTAILEHSDGVYSIMTDIVGTFTWTQEATIEQLAEIIRVIEGARKTTRLYENQEKMRRINEKLLLYSI